MNDQINAYCSETNEVLPLRDVLPLATPLFILIDVAIACNFRCSFCPTGDDALLKSVGRPNGLMELPLFRKIIDDASEFNPRLQRVLLYKDGEPFLNKDLGEMIAYAKRKNVASSIETTSNGSLIDRQRAIEIIEAGLDSIRISIEHVTDEGYKEVTKIFSDYNAIRENISFLYNEKERRKSPLKVHVKILDLKLTDTEKNKFLNDYKDISDSMDINTLMGWSNSSIKDFTLDVKPTTGMDGVTPLRDLKVCNIPFRGMAVNFNGLVSVCCVDWSFGTIIGDAGKEKLPDIWNGEKLYEFRMLHLRGQRSKIKVCSDCQYIQGESEANNIDYCAEELIEKYKQRNNLYGGNKQP